MKSCHALSVTSSSSSLSRTTSFGIISFVLINRVNGIQIQQIGDKHGCEYHGF